LSLLVPHRHRRPLLFHPLTAPANAAAKALASAALASVTWRVRRQLDERYAMAAPASVVDSGTVRLQSRGERCAKRASR